MYFRAHHGPADQLACKSHIPECEFQDGFNETKAGGVTALRIFDLRQVTRLEKLTGTYPT